MREKTREKNAKQIIDQEYYLRNRDKKIEAGKKRYRKIKREQEKELKKEFRNIHRWRIIRC